VEYGKPHPEQGQAEPMGSLPQKVRVDRTESVGNC